MSRTRESVVTVRPAAPGESATITHDPATGDVLAVVTAVYTPSDVIGEIRRVIADTPKETA